MVKRGILLPTQPGYQRRCVYEPASQCSTFSCHDAVQLAASHFGLIVSATELPSYIDRNFALLDDQGRRFVLKLANSATQRAELDFQHAAMNHLTCHGIPCPQALPTRSGEHLTQVPDGAGNLWWMHLLSWLEGSFLVDLKDHSPALNHDFGRFLGQMDRAFADFSHPAMHRRFFWNPSCAPMVMPFIQHIPAGPRRQLVQSIFDTFEQQVQPRLAELRHSVIHCDGNDYNVLVNHNQRISGVIDFGDMCYAPVVGELAIGAVYMMLGKADPLETAARIAAGFHQAFFLTALELELLYPLILTRLAVSVCMSARAAALAPGNDYHSVTQDHAWSLLEKLDKIHPNLAHYSFRDSCQLPPIPHSGQICNWLRQNSFAPILQANLKQGPLLVLDFGKDGKDRMEACEMADVADLSRQLFARMEREKHRWPGVVTMRNAASTRPNSSSPAMAARPAPCI